METQKLPKIEERIIGYFDHNHVQRIIDEMSIDNFLLVEHKSGPKQLFFKKVICEPETIILGEA